MARYSRPTSYKITLMITTLVFSSITNNPIQNNISYAHNYTPNEFASFLAFADEFVTEINLVQSNYATDNLTLAKEHTEKASKLFYRNIVSELKERDKNAVGEMIRSIETLQNLSASVSSLSLSSSSSLLSSPLPQVYLSQEQLDEVDKMVADINVKIDDLIGASIRDQEDQGINLIGNIIDSIAGIIGMKEQAERVIADEELSNIQALRTMELVDIVLEDYGDAFNVGFDMTDMSNMAMAMETDGNNFSSSAVVVNDVNATGSDMMTMMTKGNLTSLNMTNDEIIKMNSDNEFPLVSMADYQSSQALAQRTLEFFNTELRPLAAQNASSTALSNLEGGLTQLVTKINNNSPPMDVMMTVHSQVHPNLQTAFDLSLSQ